MESIMHKGQDGKKDLQSHMYQSNKGHGKKTTMDELDRWGQVIYGTSIALKFKSCVEHGIRNSVHSKFFD